VDYKKLYFNFLEYFKTTNFKDRLIRRNKHDFRRSMDYIYTEKHHIIPKHNNGKDEESNYVVLLPEEHLFIHKLRYKAFNLRGDMLAVRFIVNGLNNKTQAKEQYDYLRNNISKNIRQAYVWIKQYSASFRKEHGWQTPDGVKRISQARKNKVVVKGEDNKCFCVDKNDSRLLSGKLKHHSSGMYSFLNINTGKKEYIEIKNKQEWHVAVSDSSGEKNSNAIKLNKSEILDLCVKVTKKYNHIFKASIIKKLVKHEYNVDIPTTLLGYREKKPIKYTNDYLEGVTGLKYRPYSKENKLKVKELKYKGLI